MLILTISSIVTLAIVNAQPVTDETKAKHYLKKYGYSTESDSGPNFSQSLKKFQTFSGLPSTGSLDSQTLSQMEVPRCGAQDSSEKMSRKKKKVIRYSVTQYPESSLMSKDNIDNVILTAANLWGKEVVEIVKNEENDAPENDLEIVFCDFSECIEDYTVEKDSEEIARPVTVDGKTVIFLDSAQSWADDSTLSNLGYGGVMHLQIQLMQIILHQLGHVIGLQHNERSSSVMFPFYLDWIAGPELQPHKADFEAVRNLLSSGSAEKKMNTTTIVVMCLIVLNHFLK